jgi:uncharacterized alkaline shock family protein YloU
MSENKDYIVYPSNQGSISISTEVVAAIAAAAALECEGVASLYSIGKDMSGCLGKRTQPRA